MKAQREPLQPAALHLDDSGVPASLDYGDVYHTRAGAIEQARHVFLHGNELPQRWRQQPTFTVCETGFGLGNNFLALWQLWRHAPQAPRRLHVVSFEAHPFSRDDLKRALAHHEGELRALADALTAAWPPLLPGVHRMEFEGGRLTLTLALGKIEYMARQVEASVDAFFLDGFSPQRNPAMWSRELFGQLVRMANQGATAATWCSAGQVRRDLASAGFLVTRRPGFGGKRQMSTAVLRPGIGRESATPRALRAVVVGGGFAGAGIAHALALRDHVVTVYDPAFGSSPAGTHDGHLNAAMTPALSRDDNPMARLSRAGVLFAGLRWRHFDDAWARCGSLLQIPADESDAWKDALSHWQFPKDWASWLDVDDASDVAGTPLSWEGIWLPHGALVRPARLVQSLYAHEAIRCQAHRVAQIRRSAAGWLVLSEKAGVIDEADIVVLAMGPDTPALLGTALPGKEFSKLAQMRRMGGQIGYFHGSGLPDTRPILAGNGYWLPRDEGIHVGGSTYDFDCTQSRVSNAGFVAIAGKVSKLLDIEAGRLVSARAAPCGWAGWRAAVSDHLPVVGPVDADASLWITCAYGSRGLSWMSLAGEVVAARLSGEPLPLERDLLKAVRVR